MFSRKNNIEREVYIENISRTYEISKEAIWGQRYEKKLSSRLFLQNFYSAHTEICSSQTGEAPVTTRKIPLETTLLRGSGGTQLFQSFLYLNVWLLASGYLLEGVKASKVPSSKNTLISLIFRTGLSTSFAFFMSASASAI